MSEFPDWLEDRISGDVGYAASKAIHRALAARAICVVQARVGSSRLPGKSLAPISGKPLLHHVLTRAKAVRGLYAVVLATSDQTRDTPLTWIADECGVPVVRGSEHDVLGRFALAARTMKADTVMRVTGDCPLLDPGACEAVLAEYVLSRPLGIEYVSNDTTCSGYPDGTDCEVFSARLLYEADESAAEHASWVHGDREHVTTWMRRTQQTTRTVRYRSDLRYLKLSVDRQEDLDRVRQIFGYVNNGDYGLAATLAALRESERNGRGR